MVHKNVKKEERLDKMFQLINNFNWNVTINQLINATWFSYGQIRWELNKSWISSKKFFNTKT